MAEPLHVGDVNIFNHDVESSFFSAFLRSMPLNTEYGTGGTPKRCVYVCNKIERIENKYQLIEREIKKSGVTRNVIVVLDIDDRYRNQEIEISRRNESIFTAVVRMTSIGRVVSETDLIKDIIQRPETPISAIIGEFDRKRNNAVRVRNQFTEWIKTKSTICLVTSYVTMVLLLLTLSIKPYNYVLTSDLNEIEQQLSLIQNDLQNIMKAMDEMKPVVQPRQYIDISNACRFIIPFFCKNDPIHCNVQNTDVIENTTAEFSKSVSDMGNVFIVSGIMPYSFNDITKYFLKMCNTRNPVRSSQYIFLYRFRDQSGKLHEGYFDDCEHDVGPKILDSITNNGIENYAFVMKHTFTSKVVGPKRFQILQNLVIEIANKLKIR